MKKETIVKYEKEFLAWCKGESVLLGAPTSMHDRILIWREVRDFNDWKPLDTVYVLNDSYSIYRKALAEGKTIQYLPDDSNDWKDCTNQTSPSRQFLVHPTKYRIKPNEPKFKAGDWIRQVKSNFSDYSRICKIVDCVENNLYSVETNIFDIDCINNTDESFELWQPKPNEWCWFWNEPSDIPILAKLISIEYFLEKPTEYKIKTPSYISETVHSCMTYMYFKNCEPFIGQLPTILKD